MYIDPTRYSGRPADCASRLPKEQRCYDLLGRLGIAYFRVDHDHADTIEACEAVEQVLGEKICKNLFLCNRQKTQFYLLMLEGEKVFKRILKKADFPEKCRKIPSTTYCVLERTVLRYIWKTGGNRGMLRVSADRRTDSLPCVPDGSRRRAGEQCKEEEL